MTIEDRLSQIEKRLSELDTRTISLIKLGPRPPSYEDFADDVERIAVKLEHALLPVDRSARVMTDGSPETPDHRELDSVTGQQKGYVVLNADERSKGFVRPVRQAYTHKTCGVDTVMKLAIAETYARDPEFYDGTFCCHCRKHFPLIEFVWAGTAEQVGS